MQVSANSFTRLWAECQTNVRAAVDRVGQSGWYILGQDVQKFETELAAFCGQPHAIGCGNGMDALEISLRATGLQPGDKVLTTPLSAFPTALAILRAGGEPVYCDVDQYGLLDPDAVATTLAAHNDIRFLIPVHLYGHLADMPRLAELAEAAGVVIIEDAAQAIGARRGDTAVGAFAKTACFSFYPTKNLGTIGDAGALITRHPEIDTLSRSLRNYGQSAQYVHDEIGLNSRLDELHAAILSDAFLPRLNGWTDRRREIAAAYLAGLENADVTLLPGPDPSGSVWHLFPVLVPAERRDAFRAYLGDAGVQSGVHYPTLIPAQKAMTRRTAPLICGPLDRARTFADCEVSLPIHPFLSDAEIEHVIATVNAWNA